MHARAGKYLRSVRARTASEVRQAAQTDEARTETVAVDAPVYTPEPPVDEHAQVQPSEPAAPDRKHDDEPTWETLYDRLERGWNGPGSPSPTGPDCRSPSFAATTN